MDGFEPKKIVSLLAGFLLVATAIISGSIYPASKDVFTAAVMAAFFISLVRPDVVALKRLWPAWALLGITFLGSFWTVSIGDTLGQAFTLTACAVFAYIVAYAAGRSTKEALLKAMLIAAVLVSAYGIYQYFIGFAHTEQYLRAAGAASGLSADELARASAHLSYRRAFSTMLSPNALACYLAMAFPVALGFALGTSYRKRRAVYVIVMLLMIAALALTKSIGGFIAFSAGVLVFFTLMASTGRISLLHKRTVAAVVITALLVGVAGYAIVKQRTGGFFGIERSYSERMGYWTTSVRAAAEAPLIGTGAGTFGNVYLRHIEPGAGETRYAHNLFIQLLVETGLPGLAAIVVVFFIFFLRCFKGIREGGEKDATLVAGVAAGGAAFLVHNLVDFTYFVPETAVLFWFYFGLASGQGREDRPGGSTKALLLKTVLAVLGMVFCFFYAKSYLAAQRESEALYILRENGITSADAARSNPAPYEAVRLAGEAVSLKPFDSVLRAFLAGLYEGEASIKGPEYIARAEAQYKEAIRLSPRYPYNYRDLGILYLKLGQKEKAREQFQRALDNYPSSEAFKKYLLTTEKQ